MCGAQSYTMTQDEASGLHELATGVEVFWSSVSRVPSSCWFQRAARSRIPFQISLLMHTCKRRII